MAWKHPPSGRTSRKRGQIDAPPRGAQEDAGAGSARDFIGQRGIESLPATVPSSHWDRSQGPAWARRQWPLSICPPLLCAKLGAQGPLPSLQQPGTGDAGNKGLTASAVEGPTFSQKSPATPSLAHPVGGSRSRPLRQAGQLPVWQSLINHN